MPPKQQSSKKKKTEFDDQPINFVETSAPIKVSIDNRGDKLLDDGVIAKINNFREIGNVNSSLIKTLLSFGSDAIGGKLNPNLIYKYILHKFNLNSPPTRDFLPTIEEMVIINKFLKLFKFIRHSKNKDPQKLRELREYVFKLYNIILKKDFLQKIKRFNIESKNKVKRIYNDKRFNANLFKLNNIVKNLK